jgi:hypothetical protein
MGRIEPIEGIEKTTAAGVFGFGRERQLEGEKRTSR